MYTRNMPYNKIHFILGLLVVAIPFSGLPDSGERFLLVTIGVVLMILAVLRVLRRNVRRPSRIQTETFVEHIQIDRDDINRNEV
jgi:hypothetical protein